MVILKNARHDTLEVQASASVPFLGHQESDVDLRKSSTLFSSWKRTLASIWQRTGAPAFLRRTSTWRFIVCSGLGITLLVLAFNIGFLIWSRARPHGGNLLFKGQCDGAKSIITEWSLVINVLSTLLLGASNAAMQCLSAPTRSEVDKVHAAGSWLDIGVSGLRNWSSMGRWRKYAWAFLLLSSAPLHLLYNSVVYSTSQANDYTALLVAQPYLTSPVNVSTDDTESILGFGQWLKYGRNSPYQLPNVSQLALTLQNNISGLVHLDNEDCIEAYGRQTVTEYLNVVLITNSTVRLPHTDLLYAYYEYHSAPASSGNEDNLLNYDWICDKNTYNPGCDVQARIASAAHWNFTLYGGQSVEVTHCLAQKSSSQCTVSILPEVLIVVIICNILKALCFLALLVKQGFNPLVILGDAISSFLSSPDPNAALSAGPMSAETIRKAYFVDPLRYTIRHQGARRRSSCVPLRRVTQWHPARRYWASAVGQKRWIATVLGFLALWFTGFAFLFHEQESGGIPFSTFWTQGFGSPYPLATVQLPKGFPVVGLVLLANLPQLILSSVYLVYNDVVTCMLLGAEFVHHAEKYKGLRVTLPQGEQRNAYTLSLPLKVSVPLLVTSGVLHWAMSQSLFLAKVDVISPSGDVDPDRSFSTLGWSALALLILLIAGGLLLIVLIAAGCRRYAAGAPTVGSNSRAMLAASFTLGNGREEAVKKLKYGVVGERADGIMRVGFGSADVERLSEDELYG